MNLFDVNVLVYGFRPESERHSDYRRWLGQAVDRDVAYAVSEQVLASFVRLVTNPRIFAQPTRMSEALDLTDWILDQPNAQLVRPGERHWQLFRALCLGSEVKGARVTDAWFAALAIEHGCVWITADRDFARFPGLLWRHPLDDAAIRENPA